jgi:hypothetical protein
VQIKKENMNKRKLPIGGVQTFSKLREEYDVYVDKTQHVYDIVSKYGAVFLSRPRRFGKSLLCSTIEAIFKGEKELFEGLAISKTDWEWKEHPVIYLDMSLGDFTTDDGAELFGANIMSQLSSYAQIYNVKINTKSDISIVFRELIIELSKKISRAVLVIDEYDNPLLSTINKTELNKKIREKLKGIYSVIKGSDKYLRFVFITGVTKFSQVSVFSGMNQLNDISMDTKYCDICGITQKELEENFAP